ncbi:MAG TPA: TIR domain-containing protein [Aeromicrobium sp.]|nr:TIR domain-containing protein [Aeromicrobium sp.]
MSASTKHFSLAHSPLSPACAARAPWPTRLAGTLQRVRAFLSYRRSDSEGYAGRLRDALANRLGSDRVFMDVDTLQPGEDFQQTIAQAIRMSDVLLAIIGPTWLHATDEGGHRRLDDPEDLVRREIELALIHGTTVIPVLVQGATMPAARALPPGIASLAEKNALVIGNTDWAYKVEYLLSLLERKPLGGGPATESTNLPGDVNSLVGRQTEIEQVHRDLDAARVVTLTGPGGSGKTRLAIAAARELPERFPHGVWFVDLATVGDVALVEPAIAAVLHVRESPERTVAEALRDHLRDRRTLLVLDNLEQLLPAAADLVAGLVRSAPHVRVLVTSRELLRITGERSHPVPPLDLEEGVALFVDRAGAHRADLALTEDTLAAVRAIAERLGGLPLALELAAARVRMLTPRMILERLGRSLDLGGGARDLPERQRTLRGAVAWSYELLPEPERRLFARLGVFASGWTSDSALAVADPDAGLGIDLMEGIESLADKSLVRIEPPADEGPAAEAGPRFGMHPLLREFALERLDESGERPTVEERLAAECASIAERAGELMLHAGGEAAMAMLDREERNLHAALDWSLAHDDPRYGLRIIGASWRWFQGRGRLREARGTLTRLLEHPSPTDPRLRIAALAAAGGLAYWMRDFVAARAAYEERLALADETGDPILSADAHYDLGFIGMVSQDDAMLRSHEERALELYTAAGREDGAVLTREALVLSLFLGGEYGRARELETLNLDVFRRTGAPMQIASASTLLSAIEWRGGDVEQGWERLMEALSLFQSLEHPPGLVRVLGLASIMLLSGGPSEVGARVAGATYRLVRERGLMLGPVHVLHLPEPSTLAEAQFGLDRAAELMAEGETMKTDDLVAALAGSPAPARPILDQVSAQSS